MATNPTIIVKATDAASGVLRTIGTQVEAIRAPVERLGGAFKALGASLAVGVITSAVRNIVGVLDDLDEAAQAVGVTAVALAELRLAAVESGVGTEKLDQSLTKLNVKMADAAGGGKQAAAVFEALKIKVQDSNGNLKSTEAVLGEVADKFKDFRDGAEKTALAVQLFGKSGAAMVPFLNQGSEALRKFAGVTEESVAEAKRLQLEFDKLSANAEVFKQKIAGSVIPAINDLIEATKRIDFGQAFSKVAPGLILRDIMAQRDAALKAIEGDRKVRALTDSVDQYANSLLKAAPVVQDVTNKQKKQNEEISASRQALANYIEGLDRQRAKLDQISESEKALRFLRANPEIDTQQVRQLVLQLARENDELAEQASIREHLVQVTKNQATAEREARDAREREGANELRRAEENNRTLRELTGQADEDRIRRQQEVLDQAIYAGEVTEQQAIRAQRAIYGLGEELNRTAEAAEAMGELLARSIGELAKGNVGKDFFKDLGASILDLTTQLLIVEPIIRRIRNAVSGASGADGSFDWGSLIGGIVGSFDVGTSYVPRTGLAMVHKGERIVPAAENKSGKWGGNTTINVAMPPGNTPATAKQAGAAIARQLAITSRRLN